MKFHPEEFIFIVHRFECMRTVAVHETETIGNAPIRIEKEKLIQSEPNEREREVLSNCVDLPDAWPSDGCQRGGYALHSMLIARTWVGSRTKKIGVLFPPISQTPEKISSRILHQG